MSERSSMMTMRTVAVSSLSHVQLFVTPWTAAHQASLSFTVSQSLLKLMSIESVMPSNHLIFCHPLLLLLSIFPSIRVFSSESTLCIRWPNYWSFSFSISPFNEYSGLISFRLDWLDLLSVQETLKSLLQHHNSKASILRCSGFYGPTLTSVHLIPGSGRSPGGGHGNPLQDSCLENAMDRRAWWAAVHRVSQRQTQLKRLKHTCLHGKDHSFDIDVNLHL